MTYEKQMKSGYQGKKDLMRDLAKKLMPGFHVVDNTSDPHKNVRPFKEGGHVNMKAGNKEPYKETHKTMEEKMSTYKSGGKCTTDKKKNFAMGGVAKIRHEEATADGLPLPRSKSSRYKKSPMK